MSAEGVKIDAKEMAELIVKNDNFLILTHTGPDGDAIGSAAALLLSLRKLNKKAVAAVETMPRKFSEICGAELIGFSVDINLNNAVVIALDCADKSRLGRFESSFEKCLLRLNIDHHASNDCFGDYNYVNQYASSTAEMVYEILCYVNQFDIDKQIASALYTGILYDTGGFKHPSASAKSYHIAGELIENGAEFHKIYKRMFSTRRLSEIKLLALALDKMSVALDGRLALTVVTLEEMRLTGANPGELDSVVEFCKSVEGCQVAMFIYQKADGEFKVSLRSEPSLDISAVAKKYGGGGHKNAAGCTYFGSAEKCFEELIAEIEKTLFIEV